MRRGVSNLENTWDSPGYVVQYMLQGRPELAGTAMMRFGVNTLFGFGGLIDLASELGMDYRDTNVDETLFRWGVPEGGYLVVPFGGPGTQRDWSGWVLDYALDPVQLFLPTAAVGVIYAAAWLYLGNSGKDTHELMRLIFIVMSVGVPLLAAHAFLRFQTVRVQVLANAVRYHPGWPRDVPIDMPLDLIDRVRVRRGLAGLVFGGGTLVMDLTTGQKATIADLGDPSGAREAIEVRMNESGEALTGALEY